MAELVGKVVANAVYVVPENVDTLPPSYVELIKKAEEFSKDVRAKFNVLKVSPKTEQVSFLEYDDLFKFPFPVLRHSIAVNVEKEAVTRRSYEDYDNPPILHRKELLLGEEHPDYEEFALLTRTLEGFGLFGETARIGSQREWGSLLESVGIRLEDHRVIYTLRRKIIRHINSPASNRVGTLFTFIAYRCCLEVRVACNRPHPFRLWMWSW